MRPVLMFVALVLMLVVLPAQARCEGKMLFCETFNDEFEPVNMGDTFKGPSISFLAASDRNFGKPEIVLSIYKKEGNKESLYKRENVAVNPTWNNLGIRNLPLPEEGAYSISLTMPDGELIASGNVTISSIDTSRPVQPQETLGKKLEALFNKYSPKK